MIIIMETGGSCKLHKWHSCNDYMNLSEVHRVLEDMFTKELTDGRKRHLVFWYDQEGEFIDDIDQIHIDHVRKWKVTENNLFATKYELEKNDTETHFLLYSNMAKPNPREDWLYDLYRLGSEFATDKTTVIMRELGIIDDALRPVFKAYQRFFNNQTRFQAFQKYTVDFFTEESVDLTVLATLTKSRTNMLDDITRSLLSSQKKSENVLMENIQKFGDEDKFWLLAEKYYGYNLTERTLESLATFLLLTYTLSGQTAINIPNQWKDYVSPHSTNTIVFVDQWMNHRRDRKSYNVTANQIETMMDINQYAENWDRTDMISMDTFKIFDEKIIAYLVDQLTHDLTNFDQYLEIISMRKKLHWYDDFQFEYNAIYYATKLIRHIHRLEKFIPEETSYHLFQTYVNDYYTIDTAYRKFYISYDRIEMKEKLHGLRKKIESLYSNWYMDELAIKWGASLEHNKSLVWPIDGIIQQQDFYYQWVKPYMDRDERLFVIVSDGLRYEIAKELMDTLNNARKASTEITPMQSVLPSYTGLGMASLLPHREMKYRSDGTIIVDGISTQGTVNRNQIIQGEIAESIAIQYNDMIGMNRQALRETFFGKKLVYIYHNTIDAIGDHQATEGDVFQASEEAMKDIRTLINQLINNISVSNIIITADHGFIYQRDPVTNSQKVPQHKGNDLITNRRFILSEQAIDHEGTLTFPMDYIVNEQQPLYVTIPKGTNRFAIQGAGSNYVHGGAMLQEVVVPVITFKNDRSNSMANQVRTVDVKLISSIRKITNTNIYLEFFQTSRIEDKVLPLQLRAFFVDQYGEPISNEVRIIADSKSREAVDRAFKERFILREMIYDRQESYYLVLEDIRSGETYGRYSFTIDIAPIDK